MAKFRAAWEAAGARTSDGSQTRIKGAAAATPGVGGRRKDAPMAQTSEDLRK
jgi:hypothetical protein